MTEQKFKVGDKVRYMGNSGEFFSRYFVYNINKVGDTCYYIKDNNYNEHQISFVYHDDNFKKIGGNTMTKADLKDGMVVEYRQGDKAILLNNKLTEEYTHMNLEDYNENLIEIDGSGQYDIMKIYSTSANTLDTLFDYEKLTLTWERDEVVEMTMAEINEALGKKIKVVE